MSKQPAIPGHLIAVLVILGINAFLAPAWVFLPTMALMLLDAPLLGSSLLVVGGLSLFAGFVWLAAGLARRQAWAPRWTRRAAGSMAVVGGVYVFAKQVAPWWLAMMPLGAGDGAMQLGLGLYVLWALGRGDVRRWLAGASAPA